ncbi:MAG: DUF1488 family protein [Alphaproteobacteria bacterium]|nr:DUF1488 family protein [Alphaproteobacteria bacterium]
MLSEIPLALQTAYADLVDRCASAAFSTSFADEGVFTPKTIRGRQYWYFQITQEDGTRKQRYVGPETPELLERIKRHKEVRGDQRDRQALVSMLVRSAHLSRPIPEIGKVVEALAGAQVFRLRGVLVGTVAYQTYSPMLGIRLAAATIQTGDIDIAQFKNVSVAINEKSLPILDALHKVDPSFRPVPNLHRGSTTAYEASAGIRVDFLTPNEGPDTDKPASLPALGVTAQQLRFLDYLIYEPESAVVLYGDGIHVQVPAPQRYAVHKLIVALRRKEGAKKNKDLAQAAALLDALIVKRPHELRAAWRDAFDRGKTWRQLMGEGLGLLSQSTRDQTLALVGAPRSIVPKLDLTFSASRARYDFDRAVVEFIGEAGGETVRCAITREALEDHFQATSLSPQECLEAFRDNRSMFENIVRTKYLTWPVEETGSVLIRTEDDINRLLGNKSSRLRSGLREAASPAHRPRSTRRRR